jgi:hypothetical protein
MVVDAVVANQEQLASIWARRADGDQRMQRELEQLLDRMARALLERLYPGALDATSVAATNDRP